MADMEMLNRIARRQRGLITRLQALACGLTAGQITSRLHNGTWILVRPDVYAVAVPECGAVPARCHVGRALHRPLSSAGHLWPLRGFDQPTRLEVASSRSS
jgi:hypothetical protein